MHGKNVLVLKVTDCQRPFKISSDNYIHFMAVKYVIT